MIRKQAYKIAHRKCEICCGRGRQHPVEAHEVWLYNDALYTQTLVRVMALCPACHEVKHIGLAETNGRFDEARAHLIKVNQWAYPAIADAYIEHAFEQWDQRSNHLWTLNIDYLKQFGVDVDALSQSKPLTAPAMEIMMKEALRLPSGVQLVDLPESFDPFDHIVTERVA